MNWRVNYALLAYTELTFPLIFVSRGSVTIIPDLSKLAPPIYVAPEKSQRAVKRERAPFNVTISRFPYFRSSTLLPFTRIGVNVNAKCISAAVPRRA